MLGIFTACMFAIFVITIVQKSNIEELWHRSPRFRVVYALLICIGLVAGIVSLLYAIKTMLHIVEIN